MVGNVIFVVDTECGLAIVDNVEFSAEKQQASDIVNIGTVTIATRININISTDNRS